MFPITYIICNILEAMLSYSIVLTFKFLRSIFFHILAGFIQYNLGFYIANTVMKFQHYVFKYFHLLFVSTMLAVFHVYSPILLVNHDLISFVSP